MIEVRQEPVSVLAELDAIPISFRVDSILDVQVDGSGTGGIALIERAVVVPYIKDYDVDAGEGPSRWAKRFDVSRWAVFGAWHAIGPGRKHCRRMASPEVH